VHTEDDRGLAILVALFTMLIVSALGAAVVLTTMTESLIGAGFRAAQQSVYGAEAAGEWMVGELGAPAADWPLIAGGTTRSTFVDGPPSGIRTLSDGTAVDLGAVAAEHAGWHTYAYGRLDDLLPVAARGTGFYVVILTSPDGSAPDRVRIRALAYGPRGARAGVDMAALRRPGGVRVDSWLETR
jgi:hypothetical protein